MRRKLKIKRASICAVALCVLLCAGEQEAAAQVKVLRYNPRDTGVAFPKDGGAATFEPKQPEKPKPVLDENGAPLLPNLPNCSSAGVRRSEVFQLSPLASRLSTVFYAEDDSRQAARAQSYQGAAIPYPRGKSTFGGDVLLPFASTLDFKCLPTLFRIATENGHRYLEYREGEEAWAVVVQPTDPMSPAPAAAAVPAAPAAATANSASSAPPRLIKDNPPQRR